MTRVIPPNERAAARAFQHGKSLRVIAARLGLSEAETDKWLDSSALLEAMPPKQKNKKEGNEK